MKKLITAVLAAITCCMVVLFAACTNNEVKKPEKLKDGIALTITEGESKTIDLSEYISIEGTDFAYTVESSNKGVATVSVNGNTATVTAVAKGSATVTASADTVSVTFAVTVSAKQQVTPAPVLNQPAVSTDIDLYSAENKTDITLNFANNVENAGELELTYAVSMDGTPITLEGTSYTYTYGSYTDTAIPVVFAVKVSYNHNGEDKELNYNYTLNIKDTRAYRLANGGFETGDLTGWTLSNQKLGAVSNETHYWKNDGESAEGFAFGLDGSYMFSAYADGAEESASGTLISSEFVIGGSGFITYKLGAAKNADQVYIDIIEKDTGAILARYYNNLWQDRTDGVKSGCTLVAYKADLHEHIGKTAYIRISDYACADYGLFFVDSFVTYYASEDEVPAGFNSALALKAPENIKNEIINAGFGTGDLTGWTILTDGMTGGVINADTYWGERLPFNNNGHFLSGFDTGIAEAESWAVRSSEFTLGGSGYISVRMGSNAAAVKVFKADGTLIGTYKSNHFSDTNFPYEGDGDGKGSWAGMRTYFIDLSEFIGEELYIELHDTGAGAWAQAFFDEVITYYKDVPDVANGFDTVTAPVGKTTETNAEGQEVEVLVYGEVQLKWRLAVKED